MAEHVDAVLDRPALRAALAGLRALVLDVDGVIVLQGRPIAGAVEAVARLVELAIPFRVVTNISGSSRAVLSERFNSGGMRIAPDRIITAASAAAAFTATQHPAGAIFVVAGADALAEFEGQWLLAPDEAARPAQQAAAVVIGDGGDALSFTNLNTAFRLVRGGAELVAMHRNPWWLTAAGPTIDAGAFVAGLEFALQRPARVVGKPSPVVFRQALAGLAADLGQPRLRPAEVAMVGDDVRTDVRGAQGVGMRGVLVLTGKHGVADVVALRRTRGNPGPDAIASSLADVVAALD